MCVPHGLRTAKMCEWVVEADPWMLYYTPDYLKTQKISDDVVRRDTHSLIGVPDCFVTSQQMKIWRDRDDHDDEYVISWYEGYQKKRP